MFIEENYKDLNFVPREKFDQYLSKECIEFSELEEVMEYLRLDFEERATFDTEMYYANSLKFISALTKITSTKSSLDP